MSWVLRPLGYVGNASYGATVLWRYGMSLERLRACSRHMLVRYREGSACWDALAELGWLYRPAHH